MASSYRHGLRHRNRHHHLRSRRPCDTGRTWTAEADRNLDPSTRSRTNPAGASRACAHRTTRRASVDRPRPDRRPRVPVDTCRSSARSTELRTVRIRCTDVAASHPSARDTRCRPAWIAIVIVVFGCADVSDHGRWRRRRRRLWSIGLNGDGGGGCGLDCTTVHHQHCQQDDRRRTQTIVHDWTTQFSYLMLSEVGIQITKASRIWVLLGNLPDVMSGVQGPAFRCRRRRRRVFQRFGSVM